MQGTARDEALARTQRVSLQEAATRHYFLLVPSESLCMDLATMPTRPPQWHPPHHCHLGTAVPSHFYCHWLFPSLSALGAVVILEVQCRR